jgi:nitroreductase
MDLTEAILSRKSIRAFKPDPIPRKVLEEILESAIRAPSWGNTQPWEFFIVDGGKLQELKEAFTNLAMEAPRPDLPFVTEFPEPYATRRRNLGRKVLDVQGIDRKDKEKRRRWHLQMTRFFDAPHAILISIDRSFYQMDDLLNVWGAFGCGSVAMNIALLATSRGLGTCLEVAPVAYPDVIRQALELPDSKLMIIAIAIGYPDWDNPLNQFRSDREPLDRIARWYGFIESGTNQ